MRELFLQELNAITNYANSSNTDLTDETVKEMLTNLLNMENHQLYGNRNCPLGVEDACETKQVKKIGPRKPLEEDVVIVSLSKGELDHLINDTIATIGEIKDYVFDGKTNKNGTDIDMSDINQEQYNKLTELGYFTREALLDRLRKIRDENFPEYTCAG